jgi:hypothetical protein
MPRFRSPTDEILAIQACADMVACSLAVLNQPGVTAFVPLKARVSWPICEVRSGGSGLLPQVAHLMQ